MISHKRIENVVCRDADSVTMFLKSVAQSDEWLDIAAAANDLHNDVEARYRGLVWCCRLQRGIPKGSWSRWRSEGI